MCVNSDIAVEPCASCQECVAVETLLSIGQGSSSPTDVHLSPYQPQSQWTVPVSREGSAVVKERGSKLVWHPVPTLTPPPQSLTPPPSEAGSMSPPQSEDSCDMFETSSATQQTHFKKTSRLAQVRKRNRETVFHQATTLGPSQANNHNIMYTEFLPRDS